MIAAAASFPCLVILVDIWGLVTGKAVYSTLSSLQLVGIS